MIVDLQPWEPGLPGKAIVFGSIDNPGVAIWAAPNGEPHHYEVAGAEGIGNFLACEISPSGAVSVLFGDPTAAQDVVDRDPRLHVDEDEPDSWLFSDDKPVHEGDPLGLVAEGRRTPPVASQGHVSQIHRYKKACPDCGARVHRHFNHHKGFGFKCHSCGWYGTKPEHKVVPVPRMAEHTMMPSPDEYFNPEEFPGYHANQDYDYDQYLPGRPGKGFILPDGTAATWNIGGSGIAPTDPKWFAIAGPHHSEVAQHIGLGFHAENSDEIKEEDRQDAIENGYEYEEPPAGWHSPISIDAQGNYEFLNWNDNFRKEEHPAFTDAGLRRKPAEDAWRFSSEPLLQSRPVVTRGDDAFIGTPEEYHADVYKRYQLGPEQYEDVRGIVHPNAGTVEWFGNMPNERAQRNINSEMGLKLYHGYDNPYEDKEWKMAAAQDWHVTESDFHPEQTFFPASEGHPGRDDQRVVVTHLPTHQIIVGQPGTHHADLIHHHGLDFEAISDLPRDEREYHEPVEDDTYAWTSDEGPSSFPSLHYGWISGDGGYAHWGPKVPGVTEALHAHNLLQQPDGSMAYTKDPSGGFVPKYRRTDDWHFGKRSIWEPPAPHWVPGSGYGKFIVTPERKIFAWQNAPNANAKGNERDGRPSHWDYAEQHPDIDQEAAFGDLWSSKPQYTFGWVAPDGTLDSLGDATNRDEHMKLVEHYVPGTKAPSSDDEGWTFSKIAHGDWHYNLKGKPCTCTFNKHTMSKTAGKLHDFLMNPKSRPDLQSPEGQRWLKMLEVFHRSIGDKFDALTPWLTREWKKGRVGQSEDGRTGHMYVKRDLGDGSHTRTAIPTGELGHWADFYRSNHPVKRDMGDIMQHNIDKFTEHVRAWEHAMRETENEEALKGGKVVHTLPNGWTVRNLTTPEELAAEGNAMGHCVGSYDGAVEAGDTIIHSLRDPENRPHATIEIAPNEFEEPVPDHFLNHAFEHDAVGRAMPEDLRQKLRDYHEYDEAKQHGNGDAYLPLSDDLADAQGLYNQLKQQYRWAGRTPLPHNGDVVQIQGKGNQVPNDEYQQMLKHYFTHAYDEKSRPKWQDEDQIYDIADLDPNLEDHRAWGGYSQGGDYGLADNRPVDWRELVESLVRVHNHGRDSTYDPKHGEMAYDLARQRNAIPQFSDAVEHQSQQWQQNFDDWRDMNYEHIVPYPVEEDYHGDQQAYNAAMEDYEQDEANWIDEHPGMQASQHLYSLINPHYVEGKGYVNKPTTFSKTAMKWVYNHGELHYGPSDTYHADLRRDLIGDDEYLGHDYLQGAIDPDTHGVEFWAGAANGSDEDRERVVNRFKQEGYANAHPVEGYEYGFSIAKTALYQYKHGDTPIPWSKGEEGKALYDYRSGKIMHWKTDYKQAPHHHDVIDPDMFDVAYCFIQPDGQVMSLGGDTKGARAVAESIGGHVLPPNQQWNFSKQGAIDPWQWPQSKHDEQQAVINELLSPVDIKYHEVEPWKPGRYGKAMYSIPLDRSVAWATQGGDDGLPYHDHVADNIGPDNEYWTYDHSHRLVIHPDGRISDLHGKYADKEGTTHLAVQSVAYLTGGEPTEATNYWDFSSKLASKTAASLWVDDERGPEEGYDDWARNVAQARVLMSKNDYDHVALDHDLGTYITPHGQAHDPLAEDGTDLAEWMVEYGRIPKSVSIHSHNPDGAERMRALLEPHTNVVVDPHPRHTFEASWGEHAQESYPVVVTHDGEYHTGEDEEHHIDVMGRLGITPDQVKRFGEWYPDDDHVSWYDAHTSSGPTPGEAQGEVAPWIRAVKLNDGRVITGDGSELAHEELIANHGLNFHQIKDYGMHNPVTNAYEWDGVANAPEDISWKFGATSSVESVQGHKYTTPIVTPTRQDDPEPALEPATENTPDPQSPSNPTYSHLDPPIAQPLSGACEDRIFTPSRALLAHLRDSDKISNDIPVPFTDTGLEPWLPGEWGKGIRTPEGTVTWMDPGLTHDVVMQTLGISGMPLRIHPDGTHEDLLARQASYVKDRPSRRELPRSSSIREALDITPSDASTVYYYSGLQTPEGLEPWTAGEDGKALKLKNGQIYTWKTEDGVYPGHHDALAAIGASVDDLQGAYYTNPDGTLSPIHNWFGDERDPDWKFSESQGSPAGKGGIQIHMTDDPGTAGEYEIGEDFDKRRPLLWDAKTKTLYVGGLGQYHGEAADSHGLENEFDYGRGMWLPTGSQGWNYKPGTVDWFQKAPAPYHQDEIARQLNSETANHDEWRFASESHIELPGRVVDVPVEGDQSWGGEDWYPLIHDPESGITYRGGEGAYHADMVNAVPELKAKYARPGQGHGTIIQQAEGNGNWHGRQVGNKVVWWDKPGEQAEEWHFGAAPAWDYQKAVLTEDGLFLGQYPEQHHYDIPWSGGHLADLMLHRNDKAYQVYLDNGALDKTAIAQHMQRHLPGWSNIDDWRFSNRGPNMEQLQAVPAIANSEITHVPIFGGQGDYHPIIHIPNLNKTWIGGKGAYHYQIANAVPELGAHYPSFGNGMADVLERDHKAVWHGSWHPSYPDEIEWYNGPEQDSAWKFASTNDWEPGQDARFLVHKNQLHTWNTGDSHGEYMDYNGIAYPSDWGYIWDDGSYERYGSGEDMLPALDPRLKGEVKDWHFGAAPWNIMVGDRDASNTSYDDGDSYEYSHWPVIVDENNRQAWLGHPGSHHQDLHDDFDLDPYKYDYHTHHLIYPAGDKLIYDGPPHADLIQELAKHTGQELVPEGEDWKFSGVPRKQSDQVPAPIQVIRELKADQFPPEAWENRGGIGGEINPEHAIANYRAWEPGYSGRAIWDKTNNRAWIWKDPRLHPHKSEYLDDFDEIHHYGIHWPMMLPREEVGESIQHFNIHPDGTLEGWRGGDTAGLAAQVPELKTRDEDEYHFGSPRWVNPDADGPPEIVELGPEELRGKGFDTMKNAQHRRPFVYHTEDHQVVIGPYGSYHTQIDPNHFGHPGGILTGGVWDDSGGDRIMDFNKKIPYHVMRAISEHAGVPIEGEDYHFGAVVGPSEGWPEVPDPTKHWQALNTKSQGWHVWSDHDAHAEYMHKNGIPFEDAIDFAHYSPADKWNPEAKWKSYMQKYYNDYKEIYNRIAPEYEDFENAGKRTVQDKDDWHFGAVARPAQGGYENSSLLVPDVSGTRTFGRIHGQAVPWTKGVSGKGFIRSNGDAYLWRAEEPNDPHHPEALMSVEPNYNDRDFLNFTNGVFTVEPDGEVHQAFWGKGRPKDFSKLHPDLFPYDPTEDWHFGALPVAYDPWTPGEMGKGGLVGNEVVHWKTDGISPTHYQIINPMVNPGYRNMPIDYTKMFWIHPNGTLRFWRTPEEDTIKEVMNQIPGSHYQVGDIDPYGEDMGSEWHNFSKVASVPIPHPLIPIPNYYAEFGLNYEPWELGRPGKGFYDSANHKLLAWAVNSGRDDTAQNFMGPYHNKNIVPEDFDQNALIPFWLSPEGHVNSAWSHVIPEIAAMHPDLKPQSTEDQWDFGPRFGTAEDGEGYEWGLSEPVAHLNFPEGFEQSYSRDQSRVPFLWTVPEHGDDESHIYFGYPGSEHADIVEPSYSTGEVMHPALVKNLAYGDGTHVLGGFGSVKPRSWYTGESEDMKHRNLEFYAVNEPQTTKAVADAISSHPAFGLPQEHGFKPHVRNDRTWEEQEPWDFTGAYDEPLPEQHPDYNRLDAPINPAEVPAWRPGEFGKFVGFPDGYVHVWANQRNPYRPYDEDPIEARDGWPAHDRMAEAIGRKVNYINDGEDSPGHTFGWISPEGAIDVVDPRDPTSHQHIESVKKMHPETYEQEDKWMFAKVA